LPPRRQQTSKRVAEAITGNLEEVTSVSGGPARRHNSRQDR
jgi:hypothetical protein